MGLAGVGGTWLGLGFARLSWALSGWVEVGVGVGVGIKLELGKPLVVRLWLGPGLRVVVG